ncbi:MBL fold metallo-hydrolase [Herbidospora sp. NEAU-GS84]|uniref:MBL fold metallo-hydrolase n=1 Tax=Herbidospora solisilvae TaxID=2696284 RepID=A0A7C9J1P9_9ACTN|nr:MBL fold metallo-hydrolase [Herbidospora solisilvae]NAS22027.1 MBL fold metallo-hydrolase [Herbidospora solisilvae]
MERKTCTVRLVGGPTALLEIGGLRLLTDPAFDAPGPIPSGTRTLIKTTGPAVSLEELGDLDIVLLSHDQHADNLDRSGRALLDEVPEVLTTPEAAERLGEDITGLRPWDHLTFERPDGGSLRITWVPGRHGPPGTEDLTGPVTGFVLTAFDLPAIYVSGDNASLEATREITERLGPMDAGIFFAGAARTPLLDGFLTFTAEEVVEATLITGAEVVIPVHMEGWQHFTEGPADLLDAFEKYELADRLHLLEPGESTSF